MPKLLLPEALFIDRVESPIGTMLVFHDSEERLRALDFHDYEPRMRRLFRLHWGQEKRFRREKPEDAAGNSGGAGGLFRRQSYRDRRRFRYNRRYFLST